MNPTCTSVIVTAKDEKRKNGAYKLAEPKRQLLQAFLDFNVETDWMEAKIHTQVSKALASAVLHGSELIGTPLERVVLYDSIQFLDVNSQWDAKDQLIKSRLNILEPIKAKWVAMKQRLTKNGKFPKTEEERRRREAIKGKLDANIAKVLTEIKLEWYQIIYDNEWSRLTTRRELVSDVMERYNTGAMLKGELTYVRFLISLSVLAPEKKDKVRLGTDKELQAYAKRRATDESEAFFFKMADKLGGLVTGSRKFITARKMSYSTSGPFSSFLHLEFENQTTFSIENKIIINHSVLGNEFYQYPCTFYNLIVDGQKVLYPSELTVKKAFNLN